MNRVVVPERDDKPHKWHPKCHQKYQQNKTEQPHDKNKRTSKSKKKSTSNSIQNRTKNKVTPNKNNHLNPLKKHSTSQPQTFKRDTIHTAFSQDKTKPKQFVRKNQHTHDTRRSKSKKTSKKSTGDENQESLVEHLRAENDYYRTAYLQSKESLEKLERALQEEKQRRSSQKNWFKYQITTLQRKLSADKIRLGHIFTFDSFKQEDISNMIVEAEDESSSLIRHTILLPDDTAEHLSDLSIQSKQ